MQELKDFTTPRNLILGTTSAISLGSKRTQNGKTAPLPEIYKDDIIRHYQRLKAGGNSHLKSWTNELLAQNSSGEKQHYFSGAHESHKELAMIMLDVDCHERQPIENAKKACEFIKKNIPEFADLFIEPSARGYHGYFFIRKMRMRAADINKRLKELELWLNLHVTPRFDICKIEIKGRIPEITWGQAKYDLKALKCGGFAHLPVGMIDRFHELKRSTVITCCQLFRIINEEDYWFLHPDCPKVEMPSSKLTAKQELKGSFACKHITKAMLAHLQQGGVYHSLAKAVMKTDRLDIGHGKKLTVEFVAIMLMLANFFTNNMNEDGSLPTQRFRGMWKELEKCGDVKVKWSENEYTAARNLLSDHGLIAWEDNRYFWKQNCKGFAMKWRLSMLLNDKLNEEVELSKQSNDEELTNTIEERASLLISQSHSLLIQSLKEWSGGIIRPELVVIPPPHPLEKHDEVAEICRYEMVA